MTADLEDLRELLPDWKRHLKAANKSLGTIDTYLRSAEEYVDWLVETGQPTTLDGGDRVLRARLERFFEHLGERPNQRTGKPLAAGQVAKHFRQLQQLFRWLTDVEELLPINPFAKLTRPAVPLQPVPVLDVDQLRELLLTCKGASFEQRRDRALLWLFMDTGGRADELASLQLDGLDFEADVVHVMGKGRRARTIPFGAKSGEALRRYLRVRAKHTWATKSDALWLGRKGPLTADGIRSIFDRRADDAGVSHLNPHLFRHTFAHRWLVSGGQETDLMRLMGWKSREMIARYAASAGVERAHAAYRRLELDSDL